MNKELERQVNIHDLEVSISELVDASEIVLTPLDTFPILFG